MIVIKLGGSLAATGTLNACLERIEQVYQGRAVVIVPGGGVFCRPSEASPTTLAV